MDGAIQHLNNRDLVVMLIVFDRISNFLSTHIWKGVAGNLDQVSQLASINSSVIVSH